MTEPPNRTDSPSTTESLNPTDPPSTIGSLNTTRPHVVAAALQPTCDVDALRGRVHALADRFPLHDGREDW